MFGNPPEAAPYIAGMLNKEAGQYNVSFAYAMNKPDKESAAREQWREVQQSLDCSKGCQYAEACAARGKKDRYPTYAGGKGGCLRYYNRVEGLQGFYLPDGRPVILTDEAIAALKGVMKNETC